MHMGPDKNTRDGHTQHDVGCCLSWCLADDSYLNYDQGPGAFLCYSNIYCSLTVDNQREFMDKPVVLVLYKILVT